MFTPEVASTIELTRDVSDMKILSEKVKEYGAVQVGLMDAENFVEKVKKFKNSLNSIPNHELKVS